MELSSASSEKSRTEDEARKRDATRIKELETTLSERGHATIYDVLMHENGARIVENVGTLFEGIASGVSRGIVRGLKTAKEIQGKRDSE